MAQLFISYSTRNAEFARYLRDLLQDAGFDVWMDEAKLSAGQSWTDTLEANITNCSAFVIIMSPESKASDWVRRERLLAESCISRCSRSCLLAKPGGISPTSSMKICAQA